MAPAGQAPLKVQIVPVRGLPLVAAALAGLIAAVVSNRLWALDFFHVVGGGLWTGIDLFVGFIVGPVLGRLPVPARVAFSVRFMPKMVLLMPTLVITTLVAGWQLARHEGTILASYSHHGRRRRDGGRRHRLAGAGESGRAVRAQEAVAGRRADRAADAALRLDCRGHRRHAGGDAGDHDQAGHDVSADPAPPAAPAGPRRLRPGTARSPQRSGPRRLPPVAEMAVAAMALIVVAGIYLAARLPARAPLGTAVGLLACAAALLLAAA